MRSSRTLRRLLCLILLLASPAGAEVYLSRAEAIESAFPEADRVEERTVVLGAGQARSAEALARAPLETRLVTVYTGYSGERVLGHAFIDIHTVRTLPEAFLVVISPQGRIDKLLLLAFHEPPEYRPSGPWLAQFDRRRLDPELRLGGAIHGIAGSTLTSQAMTAGVRRSLALFEVLIRGSERHATSGTVPTAGGE